MFLLLLPFLAGAGGTGFLWWKSNKEEEEQPDLKKDLWEALKIILIILLVLLFLRWLYKKGSIQPKNNENI